MAAMLFGSHLTTLNKCAEVSSQWPHWGVRTQQHAHTDKVSADLNTHLHPSKIKLQVEQTTQAEISQM